MTVSVSLVASDNIGVTNYCLTETNDVDTCSWSGTNPTSYTFGSTGEKTLYAFVMDAAGNASLSATDSVSININVNPAYEIFNASYK